MRRKIALVFTLAAWLVATGSQWDAVQAAAWGRMIVAYSQSMPLSKAVQQTFSGEQCEICVIVQKATNQKNDGSGGAAAGKLTEKIILVTATAAPFVLEPAPRCTGLAAGMAVLSSAERATPPSPPPRVLA